MTMHIEKNDFISSARKYGLSQESTEKLWVELCSKQSPSKFDFSHLLYYLGAMLVILAMSWFFGEAWERFGGKGIFWIGLAYLLIFLLLGVSLWKKKDLKTPGGLFITLAVCMIPLVVYGLQKWSGIWVTDQPGQYRDFFSWIKGGWFLMEITTFIGGCLAFYFFRFPFLTLPIFFTLWFMSMDSVPILFGQTDHIDAIRNKTSLFFGAVLLIIAYVIDLKSEKDFAFWPYFFGLLTFWGGLSLLESSSGFGKFMYLLMNLGLLLLSILLQRTVFLVFGAIGVLLYLISIFYKYFYNSLGFPIILSLVGVLVIFLGIYYHKNHQKIESSIREFLPRSIKKWLPQRNKF